MPAPIDPHRFLCERCGYDCHDLLHGPPGQRTFVTDHCPECGSALATMLPELRPGTPFQQRPSLTTLLLTAALVFARPARLFTSMRPQRADSPGMPLCVLAALALCVPSGVTFAIMPFFRQQDDLGSLPAITTITRLILLLPAIPATYFLLLALTAIEAMGLRLWGKTTGRRTTRDIAVAIVGHASAHWLVGAIIASPGLVLLAIDAGSTVLRPLAIFLLVAGAGTGLLGFEIFSYRAVRALRYVNALPPTPTPSPDPHATPEATADQARFPTLIATDRKPRAPKPRR